MPAQPSLIKLIQGNSRVTINPLGFRIESLVLNGIPYLGYIARGDGKVASSHPCAPIFGPETTTHFNLTQHGEMRNTLAKIVSQNNHQLILEHLITEGSYPPGVEIIEDYQLTDKSFSIKTTITNRSNGAVPINFAHHFYWLTPKGWNNLKINQESVADLVKNDRGFYWGEENIIKLEGLPELLIRQDNLPYVQLWCYGSKNTFDQDYVCIEPAMGPPKSTFLGSKNSLINPQQTKINQIKISIN